MYLTEPRHDYKGASHRCSDLTVDALILREFREYQIKSIYFRNDTTRK